MTNPTISSNDAIFEKTRPMLLGLTYRMLGSHHDAEDVVHDVYEAWLVAGPETIQKPESWLSVACTRKAIDRLRYQRRLRSEYHGKWLPEPVQTQSDINAEQQILLSENLTTAFLLILDRLSPKERAAFLLREIFATDYDEIAASLGIHATTCRQLVSRARKRLKPEQIHTNPPPKQDQQGFVAAFHQAIMQGDIESLKDRLARDVQLHADSGGKAYSISRPIFGAKAVMKFFDKVLLPAWQRGGSQIAMCELNGQPALAIYEAGVPTTTFAFAYDRQSRLRTIYIMRNPDKLERLDRLFPL